MHNRSDLYLSFYFITIHLTFIYTAGKKYRDEYPKLFPSDPDPAQLEKKSDPVLDPTLIRNVKKKYLSIR